MTPTPAADAIPEFWFCPHCTDNGFHIPPAGFPATKQVAAQDLETFDMIYSQTPSKSVSDFSELAGKGINHGYPTPPTPVVPTISTNSSGHSQTASSMQPPTVSINHSNENLPSNKRSRPSNGKLSAKKKSKYSAYSSEVDKALSIIHSELEVAADVRRSETELQDKIKSLEQQLKLQDGQMTLLKREFELSKRALDVEKFKVNRLNGQSTRSSPEVAQLKEQLAKKDEELAAWKEKLKALMG